MKTKLLTAPVLATTILRVVYTENFNEDQIRLPHAKIQKMKPAYGWEYRICEAASEKANWDDSWFASYE